MFLKTAILELPKFKGLCHFLGQKTVIREKLFLGAFCHKGKFIFLKSTQKGGHFDTHINLFQGKKKFLPLFSGFRKFWAPRMSFLPKTI
jgi:hypothetical protein